MNLWVIAGGLLTVYFLYWWYLNVWNKKDNIVFANMYDLIDDKPYLINTKKPIMCRTKIIDGVEKLFLPRRYARTPMRSPLPSNYQPNTKGKRLVNLLRTGENNWLYMSNKYNLATEISTIGIMDSSTNFWMINELNASEIRHEVKDKFAWLKANIAVMAALVVAMIIVIWTIQWSGEQIDINREESKNVIDSINKLSNVFSNNEVVSNGEVIEGKDIPPGRDTGQ